jgi:hypothetical protein
VEDVANPEERTATRAPMLSTFWVTRKLEKEGNMSNDIIEKILALATQE